MGETVVHDSTDRLLRTDEVAAWLAVSKSTLVRWRQSGRGPAVCWLADGVPRYQASAVARWLAGRSGGHAASARKGRGRAYASR
ncbi:MAG: helix-turn-helix domain-containing protein [Nakamurella sp.]